MQSLKFHFHITGSVCKKVISYAATSLMIVLFAQQIYKMVYWNHSRKNTLSGKNTSFCHYDTFPHHFAFAQKSSWSQQCDSIVRKARDTKPCYLWRSNYLSKNIAKKRSCNMNKVCSFVFSFLTSETSSAHLWHIQCCIDNVLFEWPIPMINQNPALLRIAHIIYWQFTVYSVYSDWSCCSNLIYKTENTWFILHITNKYTVLICFAGLVRVVHTHLNNITAANGNWESTRIWDNTNPKTHWDSEQYKWVASIWPRFVTVYAFFDHWHMPVYHIDYWICGSLYMLP